MEEYIQMIKTVVVDFSPKVLAALAILIVGSDFNRIHNSNCEARHEET